MSTRILRGSTLVDAVDPADRGLAYGDGVFETLRLHRGEPVWWPAHWSRLCRGIAALGFLPPDEATVRAHAQALLDGHAGEGVLKLIVTRGPGGRGYAPPSAPEPTVVLSRHAMPTTPAALDLRWCATRVAAQPRLAGLKHLNRLEQVLARAEWDDPAIFDGIMLDAAGQVVGATSANVFALVGGAWLTPPVATCGIAGLMREWVLRHEPSARVDCLEPAQLVAADAVFLCNAVRGILPVRRLGEREWRPHPGVAALCRRLADAEPAFHRREI